MSRVEQLESEIQRLSTAELASLRAWFTEFDAQAWDRQFEQDVNAGKLDELTATRLVSTKPVTPPSFKAARRLHLLELLTTRYLRPFVRWPTGASRC